MKKTFTIAGMMLMIGAFLPGTASAQLYEMNYNSGGVIKQGTFYNGGYYAYVNGTRKGMWVGMINLKIRDVTAGSNWEALPTYCIQPDQYLRLPNTYHVDELSNVVADATSIKKLWAAKYWSTMPTIDEPDTSLKAAAFQTMVWEFTKDGTFDLNSGDFRLDLNNQNTARVATLASQWYADMANWSDQASLAALVSPNSQNQLRALPVPGGPLLSMVGLGSGIFFHRRRRA